MKTFKFKNFSKRDYECTNIVVIQSEKPLNENWVEVDESIIKEMNLNYLGTERQNGLTQKLYGWL